MLSQASHSSLSHPICGAVRLACEARRTRRQAGPHFMLVRPVRCDGRAAAAAAASLASCRALLWTCENPTRVQGSSGSDREGAQTARAGGGPSCCPGRRHPSRPLPQLQRCAPAATGPLPQPPPPPPSHAPGQTCGPATGRQSTDQIRPDLENPGTSLGSESWIGAAPPSDPGPPTAAAPRRAQSPAGPAARPPESATPPALLRPPPPSPAPERSCVCEDPSESSPWHRPGPRWQGGGAAPRQRRSLGTALPPPRAPPPWRAPCRFCGCARR